MDKVQHFEIPCDDMERAKKFYGEIFGWRIFDIPDMGYTMVHTAPTDEQGMIQEKGVINGGMTKRDETAKTPVLVITSSLPIMEGVNNILKIKTCHLSQINLNQNACHIKQCKDGKF